MDASATADAATMNDSGDAMGVVTFDASPMDVAATNDAATMPGEPARKGKIQIESPSWFLSSSAEIDIVVNVDSMTEMDIKTAGAYSKSIRARAAAFLSINHEINTFKVSRLPELAGVPVERHPYWMRKGYAEELFVMNHRPRRRFLQRLFG